MQVGQNKRGGSVQAGHHGLGHFDHLAGHAGHGDLNAVPVGGAGSGVHRETSLAGTAHHFPVVAAGTADLLKDLIVVSTRHRRPGHKHFLAALPAFSGSDRLQLVSYGSSSRRQSPEAGQLGGQLAAGVERPDSQGEGRALLQAGLFELHKREAVVTCEGLNVACRVTCSVLLMTDGHLVLLHTAERVPCFPGGLHPTHIGHDGWLQLGGGRRVRRRRKAGRRLLTVAVFADNGGSGESIVPAGLQTLCEDNFMAVGGCY